jgi:hypothetical protein
MCFFRSRRNTFCSGSRATTDTGREGATDVQVYSIVCIVYAIIYCTMYHPLHKDDTSSRHGLSPGLARAGRRTARGCASMTNGESQAVSLRTAPSCTASAKKNFKMMNYFCRGASQTRASSRPNLTHPADATSTIRKCEAFRHCILGKKRVMFLNADSYLVNKSSTPGRASIEL